MNSNMGQGELILIGYSGHAYVVGDAAYSSSWRIAGYFDTSEKQDNPLAIKYLGKESKALLVGSSWFVSVGDNKLRRLITEQLLGAGLLATIKHRSALIAAAVSIGQGTFIGATAVVNPKSTIGIGCIINTGAIVEHDCRLGDFVHICPGAILTGNVTVGDNSLVGAGAVVIPGVTIGSNVTIGAGSVVIRDVADNTKVVGNPARSI